MKKKTGIVPLQVLIVMIVYLVLSLACASALKLQQNKAAVSEREKQILQKALEETLFEGLADNAKEKAVQGDAEAQYNLGNMYYDGKGVEQSFKQAVYWYRKAAEQNDANAQYNLGVMYERGRGIEQSFEQAVYWYRKAAEQNYAGAQCNLGVMYERGRGIEQSYKQAVYWYLKAAEQGFARAQFNLGSMYINGNGVEKDYAKAADQGDVNAKEVLKQLQN